MHRRSLSEVEQVDRLIVGAGVIGLAVARALAQAGREVLVLEQSAGIGSGTSSRNSEVIHAGLYYRPGSLKAALCVRGFKGGRATRPVRKMSIIVGACRPRS